MSKSLGFIVICNKCEEDIVLYGTKQRLVKECVEKLIAQGFEECEFTCNNCADDHTFQIRGVKLPLDS